VPFEIVNCDMTKKNISRLLDYSYRYLGNKDTVILADQIMYLGFKYATRQGIHHYLGYFFIRM
jgi:DNA-directed RNA polymerase subunit beta'